MLAHILFRVRFEHAREPEPEAPRPQQIIAGLQNWQPWRFAKRARSCALMRVP